LCCCCRLLLLLLLTPVQVFEFWLHPHRYRTEMCKVGAGCNRRICFFAHKPEELRPLPEHLANEEGPAGGC
jgi:hypothetical protein